MESQKQLRILISGAGVAGTALAYILLHHPSPRLTPHVTLLERSPVPRTTGQAVDIRGPAVEIINRLGLEPEIKSRHTSEKGLLFLNQSGGVVARFDASGDTKYQSATSEYEILRGELAGLLLEGVEQKQREGKHVTIAYGESIKSMQDEGQNGVHVQFSHQKVKDGVFDVVIGADGIASRTRAMIFGDEDKKEHIKPSGMTLGYYSVPRLETDDELWRWCVLDKGMAMHLRPHRNGTTMGVYLSLCSPTAERTPEIDEVLHRNVQGQKEFLAERFRTAGWQSERFVEGLLASDDFYMSHWSRVVTPCWHKGNAAILGDAAYATMGIGTSFALVGAYLIAGELSGIDSTANVPAALERYETLMRPYVTRNSFVVGMQWMNPQTKWGLRMLQTAMKTVTTLRIPQVAMWLLAGGESKKGAFEFPEYAWTEQEEVEVTA